MEANACFCVSETGVKYMYFVLDKIDKVKTRLWQSILNMIFDQVEDMKWKYCRY